MNGKKKYLVIALLLVLGFGAISFAGGNEETEPVGGNASKIEEKDKEETPNRVDDVVTDEGSEDEENEDDTQLVDDTITSPTITRPVGNTSSAGSGEIVEPETQVDLGLLVTNTEKMIYDATSKENVEDAKEYYNSNEITSK